MSHKRKDFLTCVEYLFKGWHGQYSFSHTNYIFYKLKIFSVIFTSISWYPLSTLIFSSSWIPCQGHLISRTTTTPILIIQHAIFVGFWVSRALTNRYATDLLTINAINEPEMGIYNNVRDCSHGNSSRSRQEALGRVSDYAIGDI